LSTETAAWTVEVIDGFPYSELVVEEVGVVDHDAFEHSVELFGVGPKLCAVVRSA
jgi:hypothetical protein